jgi:circadian clock protein KaiB
VTTEYRFTLYVAGAGPSSRAAVENLRRLCQERLPAGRYAIEVVDVLDAVEAADAARILVTPTVVRTRPLPVRRVVGDLSAVDKVAAALQLPVPERR